MNQLSTVSDVQRFSLAMIGRRKFMILNESSTFDDRLRSAQDILRGEDLPEVETSLSRKEWICRAKEKLYSFLMWDRHVRVTELNPYRVPGQISLEMMGYRLTECAVSLLLDMNPSFVLPAKRRRLY
jgi:hypothetical protein